MPIQEVIQCACGCGETLGRFDKYGRSRRVVHGHNTKGKSMSIEQRTKIGLANKGNTGCGWSKGTTKYDNSYNNNRELRRRFKKLKESVDWTCQECGNQYLYNTRYLHINHKDGDTGNNEESNLEVKCAKCHIGGHKKHQWLERNLTEAV